MGRTIPRNVVGACTAGDLKLHAQRKYNPADIAAIGIAYQMHGLVLVDKEQNVLRNSIIWCDSRAVEIGNKAFDSNRKRKMPSAFA